MNVNTEHCLLFYEIIWAEKNMPAGNEVGYRHWALATILVNVLTKIFLRVSSRHTHTHKRFSPQ